MPPHPQCKTASSCLTEREDLNQTLLPPNQFLPNGKITGCNLGNRGKLTVREGEGDRFMLQVNSARDLGRLAKSARQRSKLTQIELAGAAGTGPRFIGELERGKPTCELDKTMRVLKMLGVKLFASAPFNIDGTDDA
jgi:HTH-type transcriptional regulator/antitoxin HipB